MQRLCGYIVTMEEGVAGLQPLPLPKRYAKQCARFAIVTSQIQFE